LAYNSASFAVAVVAAAHSVLLQSLQLQVHKFTQPEDFSLPRSMAVWLVSYHINP